MPGMEPFHIQINILTVEERFADFGKAQVFMKTPAKIRLELKHNTKSYLFIIQ